MASSFWKGKKTFVSGAGGFIGSHLVEELVRQGAKVTCFLRYNSNGIWGNLEQIEEAKKKDLTIMFGDLKDLDGLQKCVRGHEVVFHLGALVSIPYSYVHPHNYVQTNVVGTTNLLTAAMDADVKKFVHTSTSEVYGTPDTLPITEQFPLKGQSPYSASKIAADKMAESFHLAYGFPVATIRPFNTFGPRQSARAIIPTIITQALTRNVIEIGSAFPTRDFCFISDTVRGFLKVAESKKSVGETINVGTGKNISIGEVANKVKGMVKNKCSVTYDPKRARPQKSEVLNLCADIRKAKELIGWQPEVSFDSGLESTIKWISEHLDHYKSEVYQR